MAQLTPRQRGPTPRLRPSLARGRNRVALLGAAGALVSAVLLALALAWAGTSIAGAQDGGLQVSISANPANPPVSEPTTLTATIANPPLEGKPAYDWQIDFGDGNWFSVGSNPTLRYLAGGAETLGFRVTVSYGSGETATSEPITVTWVEAGEEPTPEPTEEPTPTPEPTPEPTPDPTEEPPGPPGAPAGLRATGGDAAIELGWTDPSDSAISRYQVRASADGGGSWDPDWTDITGNGADTTSHRLTGLTNDTTYTIELRAFRRETAGAASMATATPRPEPPPAPDGLTATGRDAAIELRWTDPSDGAISGYQVRVSADGGTTWDPDWTDVSGSGAATTSHTLTGLTNDTAYTIELRAVRGASSAGPAASATATPSEPAPAEEPTPTPTPEPTPEPPTPAGDYEPDPEVIDGAWTYAREMDHGHVHVLRWIRVLKTLGAVADMTAAEAQEHADTYWNVRWDPVVAELLNLESAADDYEPDQDVVDDVRRYAEETGSGFDHVLRWMRVLKTFGAIADITAAEAQGYADQGWERWDPVVAELEKLEAASPPNRAPVVNTQAANYAGLGDNKVVNYAGFIGNNNAPRGVMVWKKMEGIFTDPDGDELTYTVSFTSDRSELVNWVKFSEATQRVWIEMDGDMSWKSVRPELPNPLITTVTLTATDPEGLSASVSGNFSTRWGIYPEVVSAVASAQAIELTFDLEVEANPAPGPEQFTVHVVNADGSAGTVAVTRVAVNGAVVTLELGSALVEGQTVTLDYYYGYQGGTPLQQAGGGDYARNFSGQAVAWSLLEPPGVPENFAVSVTLGSLDVRARWDAVDGATSYRLRWRQAGGEFEAANETTVTDASATITVSGYGEWEIQLQACNDAGCVPEDDVPSVPLSLVPAPEDQSASEGQSRARSLSSTGPSDPTREAASYTVGWRRDGAVPQALPQTQPEGGRQPSGASGPTAQGNTTSPRLERGEIDGDTMTFYFSEPLNERKVGARFRVTFSWGKNWCEFTALPRRVEVSGNRVVVRGLSHGGWPGWERALASHRVQAFYYKDDRAVPASRRLQDRDGNEVLTPHRALGGSYPATRTIELSNLTGPPTLQRASVAHPRWLTLTFNEGLDGNSVPAGSAFTVTVNSSAVSLASANPVAVSGDTVRLILAGPVASTDTVTVSYAQPPNSPLRGVDGAVASFPARSVTNLVGVEPSVSGVAISSVPTADNTYAFGETVRVRLTFTGAVTVDTTGGTPRLKIKLDPNWGEKWASYASGSGTTTLVFAYTVVDPDRSTRGVAVLRDTLDLNGGSIRSARTPPKDAHLWFEGLGHDPAHMVDWRVPPPGVPSVSGVAISSDPGDDRAYALGETIEVTVTFSRTVDVTGAPRLKIQMAPHRWWFDTDDAERWANYTGGSGTAELTFNYTVLAENRSTRGVAVLRSGLELNGGTIRSTDATPRDAHLGYEELDHDPDHRVDGKTPALLTVAVAGTTVAVTYDEALDWASVPPDSAFTVKRTPLGGTEEMVSLSGPPAIAAGAVLLTLADPVLATDTGVKVSYGKPTAAANRLRDQAGNEAAGFSNQAADPTDTTQPRLERVEFDGDTITIYFSEPLDESSGSDGDYFRITLHTDMTGDSRHYGRCNFVEESYTVDPWERELYVRGNTAVVVGLSFGRRVGVGEEVINFAGYYADMYTPAYQRLRDLSGNPVSTPIRHNNRFLKTRSYPPTDNVSNLPSPERATVAGDRLTLTFDDPLDGGSVPVASAFTVKVNGSQVSLGDANPVVVSGGQVTLTLASAVAAGDSVTVSYARPARWPVRNTICEYAPSFAGEPVSNFTGVSAASAAITSDPGDDDTYILDDTIRVKLTFSEAVKVAGTPRLRIKLDQGEKWVYYESGSGTAELTFAYQVTRPNTSTQGIAVLANTLDLKYGAIRYVSSGDPAYLAHAGLGHDASHKVAWWAAPPGVPAVSGAAVTSNPVADDTYIVGDAIRVTLTFSEAMDVDTTDGTPRLKIKMDPQWGEKWADYASGSGTNRLTFAYTVVEPNHSPRGIAVPAHSLDLNGGTIRSASATPKDAHPWYAGLDHDASHKVDWRLPPPAAPPVRSVAVASDAGHDDTYARGETIRVTVTFREAVAVTGTPRLKIKMDPDRGEKWADYESGSGTATLTFAYWVAEPDTSPRGIAVLEHSLEFNGGTIRSANTQTNAHLWHWGLGHDPSHKVDWRVPPQPAGSSSVTGLAISSEPEAGNTYTLGETIRVKLAFSEVVNVTGTPRLEIKMDQGEKWANYESGSGTTSLVFAYRVAEPDTSWKGIAVLAQSLRLNGGAIRSANTQTPAYLAHRGLDPDRNHRVDWRRTGDCDPPGRC